MLAISEPVMLGSQKYKVEKGHPAELLNHPLVTVSKK